MKKIFRHNDFTAEFSDEGNNPQDKYFSFTGEIDGGSGACGDEIVKVYPAFKVLNELHLANLSGEPMYALENGFYHFKEAGYKIEALSNYWKVKLTEDQTFVLSDAIKNYTDVGRKRVVAEVMEAIRPLWKAKVEEAYRLVKSTPSDLTEIDEDINLEDFDSPEKVRSLATYLDVHFSTITEDGDRYTAQGIEYLVLDDDEANEAQDKNFDSYIDECLEIPDAMKNYFDEDAWKRDAKFDGRGHCLSGWDGEEIELIDPETGTVDFFAYRQ